MSCLFWQALCTAEALVGILTMTPTTLNPMAGSMAPTSWAQARIMALALVGAFVLLMHAGAIALGLQQVAGMGGKSLLVKSAAAWHLPWCVFEGCNCISGFATDLVS